MNGIATEDERLEKAKQLVELYEEGDIDEANRLLSELTKTRETNIFLEVGRLTRELHDALNSFQVDTHLKELTEKEIPDARERLDYVISMTEKAAHRTLSMVEETVPISEKIKHTAEDINNDLERFRGRQMNVEEFRNFLERLAGFLGRLDSDATLIQSNLTEVLLAQDYQDLTGQVIRRVIKLVQDVEDGLVKLIRVSQEQTAKIEDSIRDTKSEGPQVTSKPIGAVVNNQDEVDSLLCSLGF